MSIVMMQIYSDGSLGDEAVVTTDLEYSEAIDCVNGGDQGYCGFIFGQVYLDQVYITAEFIRGGEHRLKYFVTFQNWADY